jgi:flavin reductase (DIM6/NTAB) family NADH-FMN oxidoreductase RutF
MRAFGAGVAIVACGEGEHRIGCTVTSFSSLSLAPPTLFICLAQQSSTLKRVREAGVFSVNLLAARHETLAHRFSGRGGAHGARRFEGSNWIAAFTGAPILADSLAAFDCVVEEIVERHSHAIVLGGVVDMREGALEPALAYRRGAYVELR